VEVAGHNISTRGDIASAAIGYALGYAIDNYFFPGGLSGGVVAAVTATGSVGIKNFLDSIWSRGRKSNRFQGEPIELEQQAVKLLRYIEKIVDRSDNPKDHNLRPTLENYERMFIFFGRTVLSTSMSSTTDPFFLPERYFANI
jgi:hypothetical protein